MFRARLDWVVEGLSWEYASKSTADRVRGDAGRGGRPRRPLRGGPLAVLAIAGLLAGWTLGYAGLYYVVGLRARSPEALTALVPLFLPISLLSTAYVPAELLPGWVRAAATVNPYRHVVDAVRAAMAGTLDAGQLTAAMTAVAAAVALTQLAAARRFASLVRHD